MTTMINNYELFMNIIINDSKIQKNCMKNVLMVLISKFFSSNNELMPKEKS